MSPTPQMMADLQSLACALLESLNDKNVALSHQRKTNKSVFFSDYLPLLGHPEWWSGRPYVLLQFCIFFSVRDLRGSLADRHKTLPHDWKHVQFYNADPKIWGLPPPKKWGQNMLNLIRFWTPSHFKLEYFWNR